MVLSFAARGAVLFSLLSCGAGCAGGLFLTENGYDSQSCAESALRKGNTAGVGKDAFELFQSNCRVEDAGACSALGVAYEAGVGVARDTRAAATFYRRACDLENTRGCTNLAILEAATHPGDGAVAARSRATLETSCDASDRLACAALGRMLRDGIGGAVNVAESVDLFEKACDAGDTLGCMDLASSVGVAAPERALRLFARACTAGEPAACEALDRAGQRAGAPRGVVAAR
ncbi:MAG: tetratricopeptide repeat protein [Polyangiaceae bacterium]